MRKLNNFVIKRFLLVAGCILVMSGTASGIPVVERYRDYFQDDEVYIRMNEFYERYIENRLELGLQVSHVYMYENSRPEDESRRQTFLGYISRLDAEQHYSPRILIGYHINDYVKLRYHHGGIAARTWNFNNELSDGVVKMSGPVFSLILKYPVNEMFSPYVGLGYAFWDSRFHHDAWWHLGWSSPERYEEAGSPSETQAGRRRVIRVDNASSAVFSLGVEIQAARHLMFDLGMSVYTHSPEAQFYQVWDDSAQLTGEGEFDLSHRSYSLGMSLLF